MGEVILVPDPESWLTLSERREVYILAMVYNVRTFVAIEVYALRHLLPFEIKFGHPLAGSFESDQVDDMVTGYHLQFPHKINDSLGGNMCPDVSNVCTQLLSKTDVIEGGIAPGVCIVVVWKSRAVPDEILPPRSKPLTAASALPKDGSSIIARLSPSFTSGIDCEEVIEVIESSSEDSIGLNHCAT